MKTLGAVAVVCACLAVSAPAHAEIAYSGQVPAPYPIPGLVQQAEQFWADRGVTGCPGGIKAWEAPSLWGLDENAPARGGDCEVWFTPDALQATKWLSLGKIDTPIVCSAVTHEVGHALGLGHSATGIMAGVLPAKPLAWTPWFCRVWARDYIDAALYRHDNMTDAAKRAYLRGKS